MLGIVILLVLFIILAPGFKFVEKDKEAGISYQKSQSLKGILCIIVFLNHFTGWFTSLDPVMYALVHCGTYAVSVFFFLSSYGISKKYLSHPLNRSFIVKRFFSLFIPYWLCELTYSVVSLCTNIEIKEPVTLKNVVFSALAIVEKSEIVENSWFVPVIGLMYIIFFAGCKIKPDKKASAKIFILFIILSAVTKGRWVSTSIAFPLGVFIAEYEQKIISIMKRHYIVCLVLCLIISGSGIGLKFIGQNNTSETVMNLSDTIGSLLFPLLIYMLAYRIQIGNRILELLSKISYELYLCHGLMIRAAYAIIGNDNRILFFAVSLAFTLVLSAIVHFISAKIQKPIFRKMAS